MIAEEQTVCTEPVVSVLALLHNEVSNRYWEEHLEIQFCRRHCDEELEKNNPSKSSQSSTVSWTQEHLEIRQEQKTCVRSSRRSCLQQNPTKNQERPSVTPDPSPSIPEPQKFIMRALKPLWKKHSRNTRRQGKPLRTTTKRTCTHDARTGEFTPRNKKPPIQTATQDTLPSKTSQHEEHL